MTIDRDLPLVKIDSALIEQAFGQLLENAAKYSPAGSPIDVGARAEASGVALSVIDQGSGLTSEESRRIGQRTYRGNRHVAKIRGSGLGLWIANTFVQANGGRLETASRGAGLGTTATIHLPAATDTSPGKLGAANG
jgi:two-component system sensor histidine kinase KdpD